MDMKNAVSNVILAFEASKIFERAVRTFGTTTDFSRAAWILPDGKMLDFEGKAGLHRQEHSAIKNIFTEQELQQDPEKYVSEDIFVRDKFLDMGAVRLVSEGGGLQMRKAPTSQQEAAIQKFLAHIRYKDFFLDLEGKGSDFKQMYDNTPENRSQAIDTISKYYRGQLGGGSMLQQFRYADGEKKRQMVRD